MQTQCSAASFGFQAVEGRSVVASFDGGTLSSDAGALLLGETDRAVALIDRFAACFTDHRDPRLIEHEVRTLVGQRGDGDRAWLRGPERSRPVASRSGDGGGGGQAGGEAVRLRPGGGQVDAEPPGVGRAGAVAPAQDHPRRRGDRGVAGDAVHGSAPRAAGPDRARSRRHRRSAARHAEGPLLPRRLSQLLLPAAVCILRASPRSPPARPGPGASANGSAAGAARWRTASRNANSTCSPTAHRAKTGNPGPYEKSGIAGTLGNRKREGRCRPAVPLSFKRSWLCCPPRRHESAPYRSGRLSRGPQGVLSQ